MDINEIETHTCYDPFEVDDEIVYDYSFEDICSSFDSIEMQFVDNDVEQTVKNLFRYFRKREIPMGLDSCETLAKEYIEAREMDIKIQSASEGASTEEYSQTVLIII